MRDQFTALAKRSFILALNLSGLSLLMRPWYSGRGAILMFHRVVEPKTPILNPGLAVSTVFLESTLRYVKRLGWEFVRLGDLPALLLQDGVKRFVCCTFDDGFADNLSLALPIFRRHRVPLCVFPSTGFVDRLGWAAKAEPGTLSPRVGYVLLESLLLRSEHLECSHPDLPSVLTLHTKRAKQQAYWRLLRLEGRDPVGFNALLRELLSRRGLRGGDILDEYFLTWAQVRELSCAPEVEIGAHGVTHRRFAHLDLPEVRWEMTEARQRLEEVIGRRVSCIAYPYGSRFDCAAREFDLAREAGYRLGVTTRRGNVFPQHRMQLLALPRIGMSMAPHGRTLGYVKAALYGSRNGVMNRFVRIPSD